MTLLRYVLVQLVAYGFDLGGFYALISTGIVGPLAANVGGKIAAGLFAFLAHRRFTFNVVEPSGRAAEAVRYFVLLALNVPLSSAILAGILLIIPAPVPAKICSDVVSVGLTFLLTKHLVFGRRDRVASGQAGRTPSERRRVKTIVITGASGYIGRCLVRAAAACDWNVVAATRRQASVPSSVRWIAYDLREPPDARAFPSGALLVHLASDTAAGSAVDEAIEVSAAQRMLATVRERGMRMLFVSSQTARADAPTSYGRAKWRIEQEVLRAGGSVVRPGMVYGGEAAGVFGQLARQVENRAVLPAFLPAPHVQPIHVEDLAQAILTIGQTEHAIARAWNIAAVTPVAFHEFLRAIAAHRLRVHRAFVPVPLPLMYLLIGLSNKLLRTHLDAGRLRSLADLPPLDSRKDLDDLGLTLRPLVSGMHPSGSMRRRQLLIEGRALLRYVQGCAPRASLVRRYVRAIESVRDGNALPLPAFVWHWRAWMAALDDRRSASDIHMREFAWRLDAATVLAEATPVGAQQFLALSPHAGKLRALADITLATLSEMAWCALRIIARPARRWVVRPRHV